MALDLNQTNWLSNQLIYAQQEIQHDYFHSIPIKLYSHMSLKQPTWTQEKPPENTTHWQKQQRNSFAVMFLQHNVCSGSGLQLLRENQALKLLNASLCSQANMHIQILITSK